jgi:3-deoxy-D-manno-octulosonic-acid transferase
MYFIYSLVLALGFLILLPRFLLDALRHGKYVAGFRERWGAVPPLEAHGRTVIWIHCVSVGEAQAARPLVQGLKTQYPQSLIAISTTTLTGQTLARKIFEADAARVFYFPFDWSWVVRRTLRSIRPNIVLVMETELWPGFLRECRKQGIPVALVNGRLSSQSFRRYRFITAFMNRVLSSLDLALMQTEADAKRIRALGMDAAKTLVIGTMKFDAGTQPDNDLLTTTFRERFDLRSPLILAASTHEPEEVLILNSFRQIISKSETNPRLIIAPRHPERFVEVCDLLKTSGLRWARRTAPQSESDKQAEVILLDSIGELRSVYSLASVVFVGGSLAKTGGHNILEPAAVGVPVIVGPHTYNFQSIIETFVQADAIWQLPELSESATFVELTNAISELLDSVRGREMGRRGQNLVNENRGATEHTLRLLNSLITSSAKTWATPAVSRPDSSTA